MADKPTHTDHYAAAGVNISAGNELVERIKPIAKATHATHPGVLAGLGGFAALYELDLAAYQQPVLVSATDGVGTKLKLAQQYQQFAGLGIDLVAMCVNDLIVCGAKPLFFLDYYASGQLKVDAASEIVASIGEGCLQADMALVGGETAEMPGLYAGSDFDLAGFAVGVVDKTRLIDGQAVKPGDHIIGLASTGPHSNGYSLIRSILAQHAETDQARITRLLQPTQIYVQAVRAISALPIAAMAHITGGGLIENLPRVLPAHTAATIRCPAWPMPEIFSWLQEAGQVPWASMFRTFNCGIGYVVILPAQHSADCLAKLAAIQQPAWHIGEITETTDDKPCVQLEMTA